MSKFSAPPVVFVTLAWDLTGPESVTARAFGSTDADRGPFRYVRDTVYIVAATDDDMSGESGPELHLYSTHATAVLQADMMIRERLDDEEDNRDLDDDSWQRDVVRTLDDADKAPTPEAAERLRLQAIEQYNDHAPGKVVIEQRSVDA